MFRKALAFITRRDGTLRNRAKRRLGSPRASVFLEYAIVLPLVVLVISAMIEFAAFWDAKIMANHTAWTCARIASVEAGQQTKYVDQPAVNRLRTKTMYTATTILMSTCAMGSMHGSGSEWSEHWFNEMIKAPLEKLRDAIKSNLKTSLTKYLTDTIGKYLGTDVVSKFVEQIVKWVAEKMLNPIIEKIVSGLDSLFSGMFKWIGDVLGGHRLLRQLAYSAARLVEFPDIITVTERTDVPFVFSKRASVKVGETRLDYPRVLDSSAKTDKWMVSSDSPWPPNGQSQRMIDVKIRWPFERAWMFPVLSTQNLSADDSKSLDGVPTAVGRAMAYPQPIICNDNLKSDGATAYDPGNTNGVPDIVQKMVSKFSGFLKVAALYYHYQMKDETVGPYDSDTGNGSYKGIGVGITGDADKSKYYQNDGLVFWMDRAPDNPNKSKSEWRNKSRPPDYYQCFKEIVESSDETCLFWYGVAFHAVTRKTLDRLCNCNYRSKEWFYWSCNMNSAGDRHYRIQHGKPIDRYNEQCVNGSVTENNKMFVLPTDIRKDAFYGVSESEFNARVPSSEKGVVTWQNYCAVMKNDGAHILGSRLPTLVDVLCTQDSADTVNKDEPDSFNRLRYACEQTNNDAWNLIKGCSKELDSATGGGGDSGDPGDFMDFGISDEEIMKDPTNAAKIIEKKLNELKPKVIAAVCRVDKAEKALRDLDSQFSSKFNNWRQRRKEPLADFAVAIARGVVQSGSTSPSSVRNSIQQNQRSTCQSVLDVTKELNEFTTNYKAAVVEFYNAELELGTILNCKSAKNKQPVRPDDPDPGLPKPDDNPDRPGPSSPDSGSDNDNGGDSWSHGNDGWTKDGKGDDV